MVATFSPHRDSGGTLHLSHPGMHHVDASSAIRQLRRSLSRSPSKSSNFSLLTSRSPSKSTTPHVSSPLSPSRKQAPSDGSIFPAFHQSPLAVPYPPSAKMSRPSIRRTRSGSRSPGRRALHVSTDQGNAMPLSFEPTATGAENTPITPSANGQFDGASDKICVNTSSPAESTFAPRSTLSRTEKRRSGTFGSYATVSPLKRSDGIMNLDQASRGSPSAKRRSIYASNFTGDFSIFDNENSPPPAAESKTPESTTDESQPTTVSPNNPLASVSKRSSSLRRSTLQQRQGDRSPLARSRLPGAESPERSGSKTPTPIRPRAPLDKSLFQPRQDSMFSSKPASGSPLFPTNPNTQARPAAHPLSRTMTQSSSSSSLADDSPTHEPIHKGERPRGIFNFSKSLPVGASRPTGMRQLNREESTSSNESFATPENYKLVKPCPAAFMSTGLISKKNRNAEDPQSMLGLNKNMPDTPCKRPINLFSGHKPSPEKPVERLKLSRQSDAMPPSPINPPSSRPKAGSFARGMGIFGNGFNKPELPRRGSFASVDGEDCAQSQSPFARRDSQTLNESDLPPTPTKQSFFSSKTYPPAASQIISLERLAEGKVSTSECSPAPRLSNIC